MIGSNPFAILGLEPWVVKDLAEPEVFAIVDSQHRALSRLFHPDVTTGESSERRFQNVQWAREELDRPGMFAHYRDLYLRSTSEQWAEVRLEELWLAYAAGQTVLTHDRLYRRVATLSAFNMPPCRIRVVDEIAAMLADRPRKSEPRSSVKRPLSRYPTHVYDLEVGRQEELTLYPMECVPYDWRTPDPRQSNIPHDLPIEWYWLMEGPGQPIGKWLRTAEDAEDLEGRILGALIVQDQKAGINLEHLWPRHFVSKGLCGSSRIETVRTGFSIDLIAPYFPYISPLIREGSDCKTSLITVMMREGQPFFRIVGSVIQIYAYQTKGEPE